jgi:hypothetical protein
MLLRRQQRVHLSFQIDRWNDFREGHRAPCFLTRPGKSGKVFMQLVFPVADVEIGGGIFYGLCADRNPAASEPFIDVTFAVENNLAGHFYMRQPTRMTPQAQSPWLLF